MKAYADFINESEGTSADWHPKKLQRQLPKAQKYQFDRDGDGSHQSYRLHHHGEETTTVIGGAVKGSREGSHSFKQGHDKFKKKQEKADKAIKAIRAGEGSGMKRTKRQQDHMKRRMNKAKNRREKDLRRWGDKILKGEELPV